MRIALRAPSGYVTAEAIGPDDAGQVTANRSQIGAWELWTVQWMGPDQIALLGAHGFFLCAENGGGSVLSCNRTKAQSWETFLASGPLADGSHVTLQTADHLHYIGIGVDGEHVAHARGGPSTFTVEVIEADAQTMAASLSPLRLDGNQLRNAIGPIFLRGADLFCGYEKYLREGEDSLSPVLRELQDYRCNLGRTWLMSLNLQRNEFQRGPFDPRAYGDAFYSGIPAYAQFLASFGMYPYWSLSPDVALIGLSPTEQQEHLDRAAHAITIGLIEAQNEAAAHSGNQLATSVQTRGFHVPWCGTSYSDSDPAYQSGTWPAQDRGGVFGDLHPSRVYPNHIIDCCPAKNIYFLNNKGVLIGEGDRYGWRGNPNARQAELSANAARAGAMGMVFHSMRGERCENFDASETKPCAEKFFGAFGAI